MVDAEILKACDIRGVYPKPLGTVQAEQIGLAVGTLIKNESQRNIKVVVGHDARVSGETLKKSLIQGLRHTGLKIVDSGLVTSPLLSFATRYSDASVGIMVTASHNPPEYNGFKFFSHGSPVSIQWIDWLYQVMKSGAFNKGAGIVEKKDFYADYRNALVNTVVQNFQRAKIVVDAGNGTAALTAPEVLRALNCDVDLMNGELDGQYPARGADSSNPETLEGLGERVRKTRAQLGMAFDGDGDRVSFTDEKGREAPNDVILSLLAADYLKANKNAKIVYDGKCSGCVEKTVREMEGIPLLEKSGHSYIFDRMRREKAQLGGEASGHFFLPGGFPGDGLFAALKVLALLKENRKTLSQLTSGFPTRISTHDIKLNLPEEAVGPLYDILKNRAKEMGASVTTLDGVRAVFEEGWGIIRMSVTESTLSCRLEAPTAKQLEALASEWFKDAPEIQRVILDHIA